MGRHDVVAPVGQQVNLWYGRVDVGEHAHYRADFRGGWMSSGAHLGRVRVQRRTLLRHPLLQQQFRCAYQRIGHEPALHRLLQQHVRKSEETHPLVMRHECAYDGVILAPRHACRGVVDRFVEATSAEEPLFSQCLQIPAGLPRHHHQRQCAGVGRDDEVVAKPALETEPGDSERPVLIDVLHIGGVVAGLRNPPWHGTLPAVFDLA